MVGGWVDEGEAEGGVEICEEFMVLRAQSPGASLTLWMTDQK